jgi:hypothetical protein
MAGTAVECGIRPATPLKVAVPRVDPEEEKILVRTLLGVVKVIRVREVALGHGAELLISEVRAEVLDRVLP